MGSVPVPELPIEKPPEDEFVEVTKPTPNILEGDVPVKKKALPVKKKPDYKPVFQPAIRKALPVKKTQMREIDLLEKLHARLFNRQFNERKLVVDSNYQSLG